LQYSPAKALPQAGLAGEYCKRPVLKLRKGFMHMATKKILSIKLLYCRKR
jgi:TusA-related sulfurtransferase